ncbi:hypothetical protein ACN47E_001357 [Coniothyrium glycines]
MRAPRFVSLLPLAAALSTTDGPPAAKRVAIIGAGAGGSSAAYHLAQYAAEASIPINITVFERNSYIGGRTTTVDAWDDPNTPVELGGSIFVEVNHIMVEAMKRFNLSTAEEDIAAQLALPDLGIWNGQEFVIVTRAGDTWWDKAKLLWRYGTAPLWTNRLMKSAVGRFLTMYDEPIFPWKSLSDAVEQVGLLELTGVTGEQYLKANGIGDAFAQEIIQASTRVNYASNLPYIHGLETMVCMATSGAMQISGGNWRIFANMLNASSATLHLSTPITHMAKHPNGTYTLTTSSGTSSLFDTVILAAPYQFANLTSSPPPPHIPDSIPYTNLHTTLFASPHALDPTAFHLAPGSPVPQYILTTLPPGEAPPPDTAAAGSPGFFSISISNTGVNPHTAPPRREFVYKIFSPERVSAAFLARILGLHNTSSSSSSHSSSSSSSSSPKLAALLAPTTPDADAPAPLPGVSWIHRKRWHSYPREYPRVTFDAVQLDTALWYTSGVEAFVSTMETSALSGRNVARLVRDAWVEEGEGEGEGEERMEL